MTRPTTVNGRSWTYTRERGWVPTHGKTRLTRRGQRVFLLGAGVSAALLGFLSGPYAWVATR